MECYIAALIAPWACVSSVDSQWQCYREEIDIWRKSSPDTETKSGADLVNRILHDGRVSTHKLEDRRQIWDGIIVGLRDAGDILAKVRFTTVCPRFNDMAQEFPTWIRGVLSTRCSDHVSMFLTARFCHNFSQLLVPLSPGETRYYAVAKTKAWMGSQVGS